MPDNAFKASPHTPVHLFCADTIYMITGATYKSSALYGWSVRAWVVLNNHYHVLVTSPAGNAANLPGYVGSFHKWTARRWNTNDEQPGRRIWWNYWDRCIRTEKDFLARLKYILWNPVKHSLAETPHDCPFCNYEECMLSWENGVFGPDMAEVQDVPEF